MRAARRSARWLPTVLLVVLLPWGAVGGLATGDVPTQLPRFLGTVQYEPAVGPAGPQEGVELALYGFSPFIGAPVLLDQAVSGPDGAYELQPPAGIVYASYAIVKQEPRGLVPGRASAGSLGSVLDASMVTYPGSVVGDVCCGDFYLYDPFPAYPLMRDRYLIVTSAAVVPALDDFIAYKEFLGFDMEVITVEELDPGGQGGNFLRNAIRAYERSLDQGPRGLEYVLLIGTDNTVPFLKIMPAGDDWVRSPWWAWPEHCTDAGVPFLENMCGQSTDWYYVDLYSDWDSNGDGVLGESFWAEEGSTRDEPPAFAVDVYLGRLPYDDAATVQSALETIMAFEQDGGPWKQNALLAGAMYDHGGLKWDPADALTGTYKVASGPTDGGYLMERVWWDVLSPEGFSRVRLYEKEHPPTGYSPSHFSVDAPLTWQEVKARWTSQDWGLVQAAGQGGASGIGRRAWTADYETLGQVENPTEPFPPDYLSLKEISAPGLLYRDHAGQMVTPGAKAPVLMVMACGTGAWYNPANLAATYLAAGRISAWIGGTTGVGYRWEWQVPADGYGQSIDYIISDALFRRHLPLGEAVWTGLDDHRAIFGAGWGNGDWDSGFIAWDLYGDPSMDYWGNGPDLRASWPMFHYDWPGRGLTGLSGPGALAEVYWTQDIAATPPGSRTPSPVVSAAGQIVIGDSSGEVHAFNTVASELWSYQTDGPIDSAAAISLDGTAYVQTTNGTLYAIEEDGSLRWSRTVGQSDASPKIAGNGRIYVGGSDNNGPGGSTRYLVLAYSAAGARVGSTVVDARVTTAPSIAPDGTVWVGTAAGTLYEMSYDLDTAISHTISPGSAIGDGLALADDADQTVLVPTAAGQVVAWSAASDSVRWTFVASDTVRSAPALGPEGKVFFGSQDGWVYALDLADGSELWRYDTGGPVDSSPAVDPVNLYVVGGDPAALYVLRGAEGNYWPGPLTLEGAALGGSSPAIGDSKMVYVASSEGQLYAIGRWEMPQPPLLRAWEWPWEIYLQLDLGDPMAQHIVERRLLGGEWTPWATLAAGVSELHDARITPGQVYQYRAMALLGGGQADGAPLQGVASEYSPIVQVQAMRAVPAAPVTPTVTALSSSELHLSWTEPPSDSIGLRILRQDPGQPDFSEVALVPGGVSAFVDSGLLSDTTYAYCLQAVDEAGDSDPGGIGYGTTWPRTLPPPKQVTVYPLDDWAFRVCWVPGAADLDSVVARLAAGEEDAETLGQVVAGQVCFTDTYAYPSSFEYWVKHVAGTDESAWAVSAPTTPPVWLVAHHVFLPLVPRGGGR